MIITISVALISLSFLVLVIFSIIAIIKFIKSSNEINKFLHSTKKDIDELSVESVKLLKNLNETTIDLKKKLHALDCFFKPFAGLEGENKKVKRSDLASDIMECLSAGLILYDKIKGGIKDYVKSR